MPGVLAQPTVFALAPEASAASRGRRRLTLDTRSGDAAEPFDATTIMYETLPAGPCGPDA